ncbi:MAG: 4-alpha-glucanotransferase, partial [Thermovirgaceae bacterium]|nr:4-alpha-glucanotransferase [Thermovirgaceae bacterium]
MKSQTHSENKNLRQSGVLLHISSLPSPWGVGDFGPGAERFADFLAAAGQTLWQVLPLSPTDPGQGSSPYSGLSASAGNELFISPEILAEEGLIERFALEPPSDLPPGRADYARSAHLREPFFRKAFAAFSSKNEPDPGFASFCRDNAWWLEDFALFASLKKEFEGSPWYEWPAPLRDRKDAALEEARKDLAREIAYRSFLQYVFSGQWERVRGLCAGRGIAIMGDLPVYVSLDSADVWANRRLFDLDESGSPRNVAGVPPDYFSPWGQMWGNPLYNWDTLEREGFGWWVRRLEHAFSLFDLVRIDHFRGLVKFWS